MLGFQRVNLLSGPAVPQAGRVLGVCVQQPSGENVVVVGAATIGCVVRRLTPVDVYASLADWAAQ